MGSVNLAGASDVDDTFYISYTDFLTPSSLYIVREGEEAQRIKSTPEYFDSDGMKVDQYEATSADGTKIPYFIVMPKDFQANQHVPNHALWVRRLRDLP